MDSFRDYKNYYDSDYNSNDHNWQSDRSYNLVSKIPSRTILRAIGDWFKYGNSKKRVLQ